MAPTAFGPQFTASAQSDYGCPMSNDLVLLPDGPLLDGDALEQNLGWTLKLEGLCRDEVCVLVPDRSAIESDGKLDAVAIARLLDRPAVVDAESGVAAIGAPRTKRQSALDDLRAPDFVLPDLDGAEYALSHYRSKKRLLVAFSSW